jgi:hypothetical protein
MPRRKTSQQSATSRAVTTPTMTAPTVERIEPPPLLHTRQQAARLLSVSIATLQRLEKAGVLRPIKLSNKRTAMTLYKHDDLIVLASGR